MLRPAVLLVSLALLTGCGGTTAPSVLPAPKRVTFVAPAAPAIVAAVAAPAQPAELTILAVTPGKTTLEEFKARFKITEVKETDAKGVVTAEAGKGAVLQVDGIRSDSLVAASIDGVVFEVRLQTVEDQSTTLEKMWGQPTPGKSGAQRWESGVLNVIHFPESKTLRIFDFRKGIEAYDRGYKSP